jgi:hypothetical protein
MNRIVRLAVLALFPTLVCAAPTPKPRESITVEVSSIKTNVHTSYKRATSIFRNKLPNDAYTYTDIIFAVVDGNHVVYTCAEHNNVCPILESGSKLPAERDGDSIYISSAASSSDKKPVLTRYKLVGNGW